MAQRLVPVATRPAPTRARPKFVRGLWGQVWRIRLKLPYTPPSCYPHSMAAASVTPQGLTPKQEAFAQAVASGSSLSDAYRSSYNVSPSTPGTTTWDDASELARHPLVRPRIQQLIAAVQAATAANAAWDKARLVSQADRHRELALSGGWRGVGSANGALEIIGKATGLLVQRGEVVAPPSATALDGLSTEELRQLVAQRETLIAQRERLLRLLERDQPATGTVIPPGGQAQEPAAPRALEAGATTEPAAAGSDETG